MYMPTPTHTLIYSAPIGAFTPTIAPEEVDQGGGVTVLATTDEAEVQGAIRAAIRTGAASFAVAALAPQPQLIALGRAVGDIVPGAALLKLRDRPWGWQAPEAGEPMPRLISPEAPDAAQSAVLVVSLSGAIDPRALPLPEGAAVWQFVIDGPSPTTIRSTAQRAGFLECARRALSAAHNLHLGPLHIFPAMPAALAVELGRSWLPKVWPAPVVYDRTPAGWVVG